MSQSPDSNESTPHGAPEGDWETLRSHLYAGFRKSGAKKDEAEDLAQEALARVFAKPRKFPLPQMLVAFTTKVAKNLWIDRIRRHGRRRGKDEVQAPSEEGVEALLRTAAGAEPDDRATWNEDVSRLREALDELSSLHREVIELVVFGGMNYDDASKALGIPRGTIKSRVHYAVQYLRKRVTGKSDVSDFTGWRDE